MINSSFRVRMLCLPTILLIGGCVVSTPTDLRLVSVERENPSKLPLQNRWRATLPFKESINLVVNFSTTSNIAAHARKNGLVLSSNSFFCNSADALPSYVGNPSPNLGWYGVFWNGKDVSDPPHIPKISIDPEDSRFHFQLFLRSVQPPARVVHPEQAWNLLRNPKDVCFYINQGSVGYALRSNTVRIPEQRLKAALMPSP